MGAEPVVTMDLVESASTPTVRIQAPASIEKKKWKTNNQSSWPYRDD